MKQLHFQWEELLVMESSQVHTDARNVRARSCQRNELPSTMLRILARTRSTGAGFRSKTSPIAISSSGWKKNESLGRYVRQHFLSSSACFSADVFMTRDWKRRYAREYIYIYIFLFSSLAKKKKKKKKTKSRYSFSYLFHYFRFPYLYIFLIMTLSWNISIIDSKL